MASTLKISAPRKQNSPRYTRSKLTQNGQKWPKIGVFWPFLRFLPKSFSFKKIITRKIYYNFFYKWSISLVKGLNLILRKNYQNRVGRFWDICVLFWVIFKNRFFAFLNPVKWEFFVEFMKESCVFQLPFERVVPQLVKSNICRDIAIFAIFSSYS